jgi:hypothetical protein
MVRLFQQLPKKDVVRFAGRYVFERGTNVHTRSLPTKEGFFPIYIYFRMFEKCLSKK